MQSDPKAVNNIFFKAGACLWHQKLLTPFWRKILRCYTLFWSSQFTNFLKLVSKQMQNGSQIFFATIIFYFSTFRYLLLGEKLTEKKQFQPNFVLCFGVSFQVIYPVLKLKAHSRILNIWDPIPHRSLNDSE